jgi:hypothetical protein
MQTRGHTKLRGQRRCRYCWKLYRPDGRLGDRQKTCGARECRRQRHRDTDRSWHQRHPDYDTERRLRALKELIEATTDPSEVVRREPDPGRRLPADVVQDAIGVQGLVIAVFLVRLLRRHAQDAIRMQLAEIASRSGDSVGGVAQDAMAKTGFG